MPYLSTPTPDPLASTEPTETLRRVFGLSDEQATAALRAAHGVVEADELPPGARTSALLGLLSETLESPVPARATLRAQLDELGGAFPLPRQRRALLDALIIVACIEGEVRPARCRVIDELARGLGVRSPFVDLLAAFQKKNILAIKRGLAAHSPDARRMFRRIWDEEGLLGVYRALRFVLGLHRDSALAARFRALSSLPPGTFGHAVAGHFAARRLAYPGEQGGIPERMMHHDLMHVINGYDTTPAGECEIAGFYCGFTDGEPFTFIMTALATFHLGLRVSPAVVEPASGAFDPQRVLAAFLRGRRLAVDVMGPWDYWALMPLPVGEARERLGIGDRPALCAA
jgi:hypothetical protein